MPKIAVLAWLVIGTLLAAAVARAQAPLAAGASPQEHQKACAALPAQPTEARALALRAQCVLQGITASARPYEEARGLARKSLAQGQLDAACVLFQAFSTDPEHTYLRGATVDPEAYRKLAERPISGRGLQIEALDALGAAAVKGHVCAMNLLAEYFYATVAPQNVERLRLLAKLLQASGQAGPVIGNMDREAAGVQAMAAGTRLSVRDFFGAYRSAAQAAVAGYAARSGGKECSRGTVKAVRADEIADAAYLPLRDPFVANSYLVRGKWAETWSLDMCGVDVPVRMTFQADGGGSVFASAKYEPGR